MTDNSNISKLKAILIKYDIGQVKVISSMLNEHSEKLQPYMSLRDEFYEVFEKMQYSNGQYPFGYLTNYYFKDFERPTTPFYNGATFPPTFDKQNYHLLTEQEMAEMEQKFKVGETIELAQDNTMLGEVRDYVNDVVAKNLPIRRFEGMSELFNKLLEIRDGKWFFSVNEIAERVRPKQAVTRVEAHSGLGLETPFHCVLYAKLEAAYNTFAILEYKLKRLRDVLNSVISDLRFSQLQVSEVGKAQEDTIEKMGKPKSVGISWVERTSLLYWAETAQNWISKKWHWIRIHWKWSSIAAIAATVITLLTANYDLVSSNVKRLLSLIGLRGN